MRRAYTSLSTDRRPWNIKYDCYKQGISGAFEIDLNDPIETANKEKDIAYCREKIISKLTAKGDFEIYEDIHKRQGDR